MGPIYNHPTSAVSGYQTPLLGDGLTHRVYGFVESPTSTCSMTEFPKLDKWTNLNFQIADRFIFNSFSLHVIVEFPL
jgi:hypothetical protein